MAFDFSGNKVKIAQERTALDLMGQKIVKYLYDLTVDRDTVALQVVVDYEFADEPVDDGDNWTAQLYIKARKVVDGQIDTYTIRCGIGEGTSALKALRQAKAAANAYGWALYHQVDLRRKGFSFNA